MMGLSVSFPVVTDDSAPEIAACHGQRDKIWDLSQDERDKMCQACPLECDSTPERKYFSCCLHMGSYCYVASLADYCQHQNILQDNKFVNLTRGGGFDLIPVGDLPDLLKAITEIRETLTPMTQQAAVAYLDGKVVGYRIASPAKHSFGYDWFRSTPHYCLGVHYDKGIALILSPRRDTFSSEKVLYFQEFTCPDLTENWLGICPDDKTPPDVVRFETVPVLPEYEGMLAVFERIAEKAIKLNLDIEGC